MKSGKCLWLWFALVGVLAAGEPEVRCYRVGWSYLERAASYEAGPFWEKVETAEFESRFLKGAGELRDCRPLFSDRFGEKFTGRAVYDVAQGRLVVRAGPEDHEAIAGIIGSDIPRQIRLQASVFEMPLGSAGAGDTFWEGPPAGAKELASLASVGIPGQAFDARTAGGELALEAECQIDHQCDLVELRATIPFQNAGKAFEVKSMWTIPLGVTWVEQVGSRDGKTVLILTLKADLIQPSGVLFDEWILKEEDGEFMREERLQGMRWKPELRIETESGTSFREFLVPPTFLSFLSNTGNDGEAVDDPFAPDAGGDAERKARRWPRYDGNAPELKRWRAADLIDMRKLLMENGFEFRDEDFAVFSRPASKVLAKLSPLQMELLDGIIGIGPPELPRQIRVTLEQWEGGEAGEASGDRLVGTLGSTAVPGQTAGMSLGTHHSLEIEAQIDANDELVEIRSSLFSGRGKKKRPIFRTALTLDNDQSVVIQESRIDGKRRAWVIKARIVDLAREVDHVLKEQGR